MSAPHTWYQWNGDLLILNLRVQPRARRDAIDGVQGDRLRIRITAPPVDGKANTHLISFLAERFGVTRSQVTLLGGTGGRDKRVGIQSPRRMPPDLPPVAPT